jgi:hypothetical protein
MNDTTVPIPELTPVISFGVSGVGGSNAQFAPPSINVKAEDRCWEIYREGTTAGYLCRRCQRFFYYRQDHQCVEMLAPYYMVRDLYKAQADLLRRVTELEEAVGLVPPGGGAHL